MPQHVRVKAVLCNYGSADTALHLPAFSAEDIGYFS